MELCQACTEVSPRKSVDEAISGMAFIPLTVPHTDGISAGCPSLTGVEPSQLAEASQTQFEQSLLLGAQRVCQHPQGFTLQHWGWEDIYGTLSDHMPPQIPTQPCIRVAHWPMLHPLSLHFQLPWGPILSVPTA